MIVNTPDGQVNFPDSMSQSDVEAALSKLYSAKSGEAPSAPTAATASGEPGYFSMETQLGPISRLFGYHPKAQPETLGNVADIARVTASQIPGVSKLTGIDEAAAQERLKGTPYAGAGEALGGSLLGIGGEALGAGRYIAGKASPYIGDFLANRIGGAVEQGGASVAGTLGEGDTNVGDLLKSAAIGVGGGAVMGPMVKAAGAPVVAKTTAELERDAKDAWTQVRTAPVNPSDAQAAMNYTRNAMQPGERVKMSGVFSNKLDDIDDEIASSNTLSASDVAHFQQALNENTRTSVDGPLAARFSEALDNVYGSAKPLVDDAKLATNRAKASGEIDDWLKNPAKAPARISSALENNPDLYKTTPGLYDALDQIGQAKDPTFLQRFGEGALKRTVSGALGGVAGGIAGSLFGQGAPGDIAGGAIGAGLASALIPQIGAGRVTGIARQLKAAQHLAATGQSLPPGGVGNALLNLGRQGAFGAGAAGAY